jgi:hypothetical protein
MNWAKAMAMFINCRNPEAHRRSGQSRDPLDKRRGLA